MRPLLRRQSQERHTLGHTSIEHEGSCYLVLWDQGGISRRKYGQIVRFLLLCGRFFVVRSTKITISPTLKARHRIVVTHLTHGHTARQGPCYFRTTDTPSTTSSDDFPRCVPRCLSLCWCCVPTTRQLHSRLVVVHY